MKKTICTLTALAVAATTLLTGCGTSKPTDTATNNGEKVSFILGLPGGDGVTAAKVVDNFLAATKDKYDIEIDESSWGDFDQKVRLQFTAKNEVTTTFVTDSLSAPSFGAQGALEDLDARVKADIDESLYTSALRALTDTEGHLWGVPHGINSIAVVYNKDLFDKAGIAYPTEDWTFEEMLEDARKLNDPQNGVYGISYGTNITQGWLPFFAAVGANPYKDGFRNSNLDDPKVAEALEKFAIAHREGLCPSEAEVAAHGKKENMFAEGKLAMYICQASGTTTINALNPELNYDAQIMPIGWNGKRTCVYVPNVWVMYAGATDAQKDAAWEWMKYYLSEEAQMILSTDAPAGYPSMKKALDAVSANGVKPEGKDAFYRGIDEYGMTILENPCSSQVEQIMQPLVTDVRDNTKPMSELLKEARENMQSELDFYYENL